MMSNQTDLKSRQVCADLLIVGGGVIGLMSARRFADAGYQVTVVDRSEACREATWAGGGIISPLYPWRYSSAISTLAKQSQQLYPHLLAAIQQESGIDPEYDCTGLCMTAVPDIDSGIAWAEETAVTVDKISADQAGLQWPTIAWSKTPAYFWPQIGRVRNPRLGAGLRQICRKHPKIQLLEHTELVSAKLSGQQLVSVSDQSGKTYTAERFLISAGAWTSKILQWLQQQASQEYGQHAFTNLSLHSRVHIKPIRGQMIAFQGKPGQLPTIILSQGRYLIPRRNGLILVGSTQEDVGFVKETTEQAKNALMNFAIELMPALSQAKIVHQWSGLRPGSPAGIPYIDRVPHLKNAFVNAGHFRNGLVLAPAAVEVGFALIDADLNQKSLKASLQVQAAQYQIRQDRSHASPDLIF